MEPINEFSFYELAIAIHPLTTSLHNAKYSEVWFAWYQASQALEQIFRKRSLEFCTQAANELYSAINAIVPHDMNEAIQKLQNLSQPEPILGWLTSPVEQAANKFETVLSAELSNSDTYWISPKGTHKTSMLLRSARSLLPASVLEEIPEVAFDFDEAGRCWLFDAYTAASFHLMRATESVIRKYYKAATGVEPKVRFRNWGAYIKHLKECPQADQKVVQFIEQIKDNYRNPVLHPEQNLSAEDAQILVGVCVSVISMMVAGIRRLTETGQQLPFTESAKLLQS